MIHKLFFCFVIFINFSFSQGVYDDNYIEKKFQQAVEVKSRILVVPILEDESQYFKNLIEAVEKYWHFSKVEFVKASETLKYINNNKYAVLHNFRNYRLDIVLGDSTIGESQKRYQKFCVASVRLLENTYPTDPHYDKYQAEKPFEDYVKLRFISDAWAMNILIQSLNAQLNFFHAKEMASCKVGNRKVGKEFKTYYKYDFSEKVKEKKIFVLNSASRTYTFTAKTIAKSLNIKQEQVFFVELEDLLRAIEKREEDVIFIMPRLQLLDVKTLLFVGYQKPRL